MGLSYPSGTARLDKFLVDYTTEEFLPTVVIQATSMFCSDLMMELSSLLFKAFRTVREDWLN